VTTASVTTAAEVDICRVIARRQQNVLGMNATSVAALITCSATARRTWEMATRVYVATTVTRWDTSRGIALWSVKLSSLIWLLLLHPLSIDLGVGVVCGSSPYDARRH